MSASVDVERLATALHACLGVALLLPWNSFITAVDYFAARYPNAHIDRLFGVCYTYSTLVTLLVNVTCGLEKYAAGRRIAAGFSMFLVAVVLVPVIGAAAKQPASGSLVAVLACVILTGVGDGLAQGALFGSVAGFHPRHSQAIIWGMSFSGLFVSVLRIATKAASPGDDPAALEQSATMYFAISALWVFLCLLARPLAASSLRLYEKLAKVQQAGVVSEMELTHSTSLSSTASSSSFEESRTRRPSTSDKARLLGDGSLASEAHSNPVADTEVGDVDAAALARLPSPPSSSPPPLPVTRAPRRAVFGFVSHRAFLVGMCYAVSLAIFPGFLAENVASKSLGDWYPILLITTFNAGDVVGKALPAVPCLLPTRTRTYMMLSWSRLIFFPLYYLIGRASSENTPPSVVAATFVLTFLLGMTSGHLGAALMMTYAPLVTIGLARNGWSSFESSALEVAGMIMALSLVCGLAVGTSAAYLWLL